MVRQLKEYHTRCGKIINDLLNTSDITEGTGYSGTPHYVLHNVSGPAVTYPSGYEAFWVHGLRHCITGPAIRYSSGKELFYLFGKRYSRADYNKLVKKLINSSMIEQLIDEQINIRQCAEESLRILNENKLHKISGKKSRRSITSEGM